MRVALRGRLPHFSEDDHSGRTPVHAQRATGADVVIDDEDHLILRVGARAFSVDRGRNCIR